MPIQPGQVLNPNGRPKGVPNKITRTVRVAFEEAFTVLERHTDAARAAHPEGPDGTSRRVRIYLDGFPLP